MGDIETTSKQQGCSAMSDAKQEPGTITLMQHQLRMVEIARRQPKFAFFHEMGCGKTIGILAAIDDAKRRGVGGKTLVCCPLSIMHTGWSRDAAHFPDLKTVVCYHENKERRLQLIKSKADVLVTNYEQFRIHAAEFAAAGVTRLVLDESSKIKACRALPGGESKIAAAAIAFAARCDSVILLSGTPAPNTAVEYFSQVSCIDPDIFGRNSYPFAHKYFAPVERKIMVKGQPRKIIAGWSPKPHMQDEFLAKLRSVSWSLKASECVDLPDETDDVREVEMTAGEKSVYRTVLTELKVEHIDGTESQIMNGARMMKLRQITGGSVLIDGRPEKLGDSKLSALAELIEELGDAQLVVWATFTHEIDLLTSFLKSVATAEKIDGSVGANDRREIVESFQAGELRYIVAHPRAAGHGLTLTAARHDCWYSLDWMPEAHDQGRKRIHRVSQKWPVVHHYLVACGTVDEKVLDVLKHKSTASEAIKSLLGRKVEMVAA